MTTPQSVSPRLKVMLGSSAAGRPFAEHLRSGLGGIAEVTAWCEGEMAPSPTAFDAAAFVVSSERECAVVFRLGVFLGALGRERVVVCPASDAVAIPPDLHCLTVAHHPAALAEQLHRLAASAPSAVAADSPGDPSPGHVARRLRRSLGTAASAQAGQTLRIVDISLTGALLETFGEIPENQVLDLDLALEDGRRIRAAAKVVRIQYPQWGRVGGVGVQFVRFEGDAQAELARYLEATEARPTPERVPR